MRVELFVLCDAATDYKGKLNVLGTFDAVWANKVPVVYHQCAVAMRLRFSKLEEGKHRIKINIIDEDGGKVIPPLEAYVNINLKNSPHSSIAANLILNIHGLKIQKYGEYAIDLIVDGNHEASLPLYVNQAA